MGAINKNDKPLAPAQCLCDLCNRKDSCGRGGYVVDNEQARLSANFSHNPIYDRFITKSEGKFDRPDHSSVSSCKPFRAHTNSPIDVVSDDNFLSGAKSK